MPIGRWQRSADDVDSRPGGGRHAAGSCAGPAARAARRVPCISVHRLDAVRARSHRPGALVAYALAQLLGCDGELGRAHRIGARRRARRGQDRDASAVADVRRSSPPPSVRAWRTPSSSCSIRTASTTRRRRTLGGAPGRRPVWWRSPRRSPRCSKGSAACGSCSASTPECLDVAWRAFRRPPPGDDAVRALRRPRAPARAAPGVPAASQTARLWSEGVVDRATKEVARIRNARYGRLPLLLQRAIRRLRALEGPSEEAVAPGGCRARGICA